MAVAHAQPRKSAQSRANIIRWLLILVALGTLIAGIYYAVRVSGQILIELIELGWADYVGRPTIGPFLFFFFCQANSTCQGVFNEAWLARYPAVPVIATFFVSAFGAAVSSSLAAGPGVTKLPGGARWADKRDLKPLIKDRKDDPRRGYLGLHADSGAMLRPPERDRCAHTLIIGGTGAGKSTAYFKPNLMRDALEGNSAVVFDLKYPDSSSGLFDMVPVFKQAGHDVQLFLPYSKYSLYLPLLAGAENSIEAANITDMIAPTQTRTNDGGFYNKQQRAMLHGLILAQARSERPSLAAITKLLLSGTAEVHAYVRNHPDQEVRERLLGIFEQDNRIVHGIVRGLVEELEMFNDPRLARATSVSHGTENHANLSTIGEQPSLLYIGIPQEELMRTRGQTLLQLVKRMLDTQLIRTANKHGGRLPVHSNVYLDEFASLGPLPHVGENFATMRSRRVAYHVSLQNLSQGDAVYGTTNFRAFIAGNFRQTLLFARHLAFEDAQHYSTALGELTTLSEMRGTSRRHIFEWPRHDRRSHEVALPLAAAEELREWPHGEGILLRHGSPPTRVLLPRLDERRAGRYRNPMHKHNRTMMGNEVDVAQVSQDLILERTHAMRLLRLMRDQAEGQARGEPARLVPKLEASHEPAPQGEALTSVTEIVQATSDTSSGNLRPNVESSDAKPNVRQKLIAWLDALEASHVPVQAKAKAHRKHEVGQLVIPQASIPASLAKPNELDAWLERGWVRPTGDALIVEAEGVQMVGDRAKHLQALTKQRQRERAKEEQAKRIRTKFAVGRQNHMVATLRAWIEEHGAQLEGHPHFEALSEPEKERVDLLGRYTAPSVTLFVETVKTILNTVPGDLQKVRRGKRVAVLIPVDRLKLHQALHQWCLNNAHLLAGHPKRDEMADDTQPDDEGAYQPEMLALPKTEFKRILGDVPPDAKRRDLKLTKAEKRRRVYEVVLSDRGSELW